MSRGRAQLVLVAAAVVAVALAPVVVAYVQLGYHADVRAGAEYEAPAADATRLLERAVHGAAAAHRGEPWARRAAVVAGVRSDLAPRLATLEASRVEEGIGYHVRYNGSAAERVADRRCPGGRGRAFGPCRATDGVVVQERAGETTVVAVAFDLRIARDRGSAELLVVVEPV